MSRFNMTNEIPFIDLFCGAGGLSAGFEMANFNSKFAIDNDTFACDTYGRNHQNARIINRDIVSINAKTIANETGLTRFPVILGGPNCQGVSLRGLRNPEDPKNKMFYHFVRIISELQPSVFVMENVPGLLHRHNRELATEIFREFHSIGYRCGAEIVLAADYGVPQLRYRLILIGTRTASDIIFPEPTHEMPKENSCVHDNHFKSRRPWVTVKEAISDLPRIENGGGAEVMSRDDNDVSLSEYQQWAQCKTGFIYNHQCHKTSEKNVELIKHIKPGQNWKAIPEEIRPERFKHVALKDHTTTYKRLEWNMPARTITTYFNNISAGAFTHPEVNRGISVREGARL